MKTEASTEKKVERIEIRKLGKLETTSASSNPNG